MPAEEVGEPWAALFAPAPPVGLVRVWLESLGFNRGAPAEVLLALFDVDRAGFLHRADLPPGVMDAAAVHPSKQVWGRAVDSWRLTPAQWQLAIEARTSPAHRALVAELAADHAPRHLRTPAPDPAPAPERIAELCEAVPDITPEHVTYELDWVRALHHDPDAMRQLAASPKAWIRRSVARAPHLPEDVLRVLAEDEDRVVHLFLSESCEDTPAEVLLGVWTWWSGSLSHPGRPRSHPNFPRDGLLRFADHAEPRMRLLALDDPAAPAALAERFADDPSPLVRLRAAEDPRLVAGTAARLLADGDASVRALARRHPALPVGTLVGLLLDPETAGDAVQNRAVPVDVMLRMVACERRPSARG
ncbi:hypothetical protein ACIRBX_32545 [Kitasatospora sp. NPDC096147]|uniref:hypothetical protein n=1 Tax=Kitasatospora sp. NPDC096147 TaxID=3364093 RepID=UPI00380BC02F